MLKLHRVFRLNIIAIPTLKLEKVETVMNVYTFEFTMALDLLAC